MATPKPTKRSRSPSRSSASKRLRIFDSRTETVKFLILSDTHDANLPSYHKCDVVLHCGDLTEDGSPSSIANALKTFTKIDAELKLVIAGNHEISLDRDYYLAEGGSEIEHEKAFELVHGPEASDAGVTFLDEGTHTFTLKSGATFTVYASPFTPMYGASAFQYPTNEDRYSFSSPKWAKNVATEKSFIPETMDIVMAHGPPKYLLDSTSDGRSAGCEYLRRAIARAKPRLHCFGHIHRGYGAQRIEFKAEGVEDGEEEDCVVPLPQEWVGKNQSRRKGYASLPSNSAEAYRARKQTLLVNAALMDEKDELGNAPWLVELDLPVSKGPEGCHSAQRMGLDSHCVEQTSPLYPSEGSS